MDEDWREVIADWRGEMGFTGSNPAKVNVQMGTLNGRPGVSPMELLLMGVAGCSGMDIVSILQKKRQDLKEFQVLVRGKRANEHPRIYTDIEVTYLFWGNELDPKAIEHAIQLSEEKYCSASIMLRASARMRSTYRILSPSEKVEA